MFVCHRSIPSYVVLTIVCSVLVNLNREASLGGRRLLTWLLRGAPSSLHGLSIALDLTRLLALHWLPVTLWLHAVALRLALWWHAVALRLALHRLTVALRLALHRLTISLTGCHCLWHTAIALHRWLLPRHRLLRHGLSVSTVSWHLTGGCCTSWLLAGSLRGAASDTAKLAHQIILLQVTAHFVIVDALLQADQNVVKLHVELGSLLQLH